MSSKSFALPLVSIVSFIAGGLVSFAPTATHAQAQNQAKGPKYLLVDYMKVNPGKDADYYRLEHDIWKPIHQEFVKDGKKRFWSFYGVRFPSGADEKFDYVTVNGFDNFAQIEEPYTNLPEVVKKIHPNMKMEELGEKTESPRRIV